MVEIGRFVDGLKTAGVEFFAGVPDSLLKSFCAYVTDTCVVKKLLHQFYSTDGVSPFDPKKVSTHYERAIAVLWSL